MRNSIHCMLLTTGLALAAVSPAAAQEAGTSLRFGPGGVSEAAGWTRGGRGDVHTTSGEHFASSSAFSTRPGGGYSYSSHDAIRLADGSILGFGHQMHSGPDGEGYGTTDVRIHRGGSLEMSGRVGPGMIESFGGGTGDHVVTNSRTDYHRRQRSPKRIRWSEPRIPQSREYCTDPLDEPDYGDPAYEYQDAYGAPIPHGVEMIEIIGPVVFRAGGGW